MDSIDYLTRQLLHRLDALSIAALMLKFRLKWEEPKPMQIYVEGELRFEGLTTMLTNSTVENGVLHARALLEFVGLKAREGRLVQIDPKSRNSDDAAIEELVGPEGTLPLVSLADVGAIHPADTEGALSALANLIMAAHKGLAHASASYFSNPVDAREVLLALQLTEQIVERHVYYPLGKVRPPPPIEARERA
jgi:hypothetical protein